MEIGQKLKEKRSVLGLSQGCFYLPENPAKRYDEGEQYILYRFDWDGGEFLFCLKFQ